MTIAAAPSPESVGAPVPVRRRRVLVLAPFPPRLDAAHGGARTIALTVRGLGARDDVGLMYLRGRGEPDADAAVRDACVFAEGVARPDPGRGIRRAVRAGGHLLRGRPVWVGEWRSDAFLARLRERAREWPPEVVQVEFHVMAQYLDAFAGRPVPRLLVEHEAGVLAANDLRAGLRTGPTRLVAGLDQRAWRRYERTVVADVDRVTVYSRYDLAALRELSPAIPIRIVPLGVRLAPSPLPPSGEPLVLFVGSFRHRPNVDAALRLASDIHPRVRAWFPDARLIIVGEDPPGALRALGGSGVTITGRVPDVAPYLEQAAVTVAPLRLGGGMRVKVLEALGAGRPVVASALAAAGAEGEHLVLAETDAEFAAAIARLLGEPDRRAALGRAGHAWAMRHASPEVMVAACVAAHDEILAGARERA